MSNTQNLAATIGEHLSTVADGAQIGIDAMHYKGERGSLGLDAGCMERAIGELSTASLRSVTTGMLAGFSEADSRIQEGAAGIRAAGDGSEQSHLEYIAKSADKISRTFNAEENSTAAVIHEVNGELDEIDSLLAALRQKLGHVAALADTIAPRSDYIDQVREGAEGISHSTELYVWTTGVEVPIPAMFQHK